MYTYKRAIAIYSPQYYLVKETMLKALADINYDYIDDPCYKVLTFSDVITRFYNGSLKVSYLSSDDIISMRSIIGEISNYCECEGLCDDGYMHDIHELSPESELILVTMEFRYEL